MLLMYLFFVLTKTANVNIIDGLKRGFRKLNNEVFINKMCCGIKHRDSYFQVIIC